MLNRAHLKSVRRDVRERHGLAATSTSVAESYFPLLVAVWLGAACPGCSCSSKHVGAALMDRKLSPYGRGIVAEPEWGSGLTALHRLPGSTEAQTLAVSRAGLAEPPANGLLPCVCPIVCFSVSVQPMAGIQLKAQM